MKYLLILASVCCLNGTLHAQSSTTDSAKVRTAAEFRDLLLANKWSWRNVSANIPDRECVFMPDGTFRHPHFIARFTIKDMHTVDLSRKAEGGRIGNEHAVMNFSPDYSSFEVIDFDQKRRISGTRLRK